MIPSWAYRYGAVALVCIGATWWVMGLRWDSDVSRIDASHAVQMADYAEAATKSANEAIETTLQRLQQQEIATNEAREQEAATKARLVTANANAAGLRKRIDTLSASIIRANPSLADGSASGAGGINMLAQLSGKIIDRSTALAVIADRSRVAGLTCEKLWDGLRNQTQ